MNISAQRTVALIGRPNVGKSRLFNRLVGRRLAIVHDMAGVTRDVNSAEVKEGSFILMDTGGIGLVTDMDHQKLIAAAEAQVWLAVETAAVICLVVDAREGIMSLDYTLAERIRGQGKPIILVVNKVDQPDQDQLLEPFYELGFERMVAVSAEHGYGEGHLRDALAEILGPAPETTEEATLSSETRTRLAIVGKPNVGKSSLCNALLQSQRLVVSEVAGTTRDSVELDLDYTPEGDTQALPFRLVDTAGLKRRTKLKNSVEYFATLRSEKAIEQADIVFLMLDAETGVTKNDKAWAGLIADAGKTVGIIVNKWDIALERFRDDPLSGYDNENAFRKAYQTAVQKELFVLPDPPVIFVSAQTGYQVEHLLKLARSLHQRSRQTLRTSQLNQLISKMMQAREPRHVKGRRFKVYYSVQTGNNPYRFRLYCNREGKLDDSYRRYLQNGMVEAFSLQGCPIRFELRGKEARYTERK